VHSGTQVACYASMIPSRYSIPIGIVGIALLAWYQRAVAAGEFGLPGQMLARPTLRPAWAVRSDPLAPGWVGGKGGGTEAGSTAGTTGTGGSAVPPSSAGGAEAGSGPGADAAGDVSRPDGSGAVPDSSVASDVKVLCYDQTAVGCTTSSDCSDSRTCVQRVINPCAGLTCQACGMAVSVCL